MSLYADYLREKSDTLILETDQGFATYRYTCENTVYVLDIYVIPAKRLSGAARYITDKIVDQAKARGCTRLLGSVVPSSKGSTESLRALLAYGFQLDSASNDFILFSKVI